jgi:chemotaxis protein methyltransferase CheR
MASSLSARELDLIRDYIEKECGIALGKDKAYLIESRLSKILIDSGFSSYEELYRTIYQHRDPAMAEKVIDAITTNETLWFRDGGPWTVLEKRLLPEYIQELRTRKTRRIRIWSAAASTGQEAYSIAMSIDRYLLEHAITDVNLSDFEIMATDISPTVLEIAEKGRYDSISIMRGLPTIYRDRYFRNEGRVWILDERIRQAVSFQRFNLQHSFLVLGKFNLVFCRYVLLYFSNDFKQEILNKMARVLDSGGAFFIGSSEILNQYSNWFDRQEHQGTVFYSQKG